MKSLSSIFSLALLCLVGGPLADIVRAAAPPNIVLILSDDQGWTDDGFMGHESIQTPN